MKVWKIGGLCVVLILLVAIIYFLNTRVWVDRYDIDGNTLKFKNVLYVRKDTLTESDASNLGRRIGIAVNGQRNITDYIWPDWIYEYKSDKGHDRIFVRGLMDLGSTYIKQ